MSPAAAAAMARGALRLESDSELQAATNSTAQSEARERPWSASELGPIGELPELARPNAPIGVGGLSFAGQIDPTVTPPDTTGAIGQTRFIQLVNRRFGIYDRANGQLINSGTLNTLAGLGVGPNSFDPQIIWDATTSRFYYVMDSVFSSTDNKLSFGFSKTGSPSNGTTDWCHYTYTPADPTRFPDYPKLGDSRDFIIIGVNSFEPDDVFVGSDLVAISKPPSGSTCPLEIFKAGTVLDLRDTSTARVFTPVPANQIDTIATGYVVARNGALPSTSLWFFNVTSNAATGFPIFDGARGLTVASYTIPPDANQPPSVPPFGYNPLLDTLDARPTQAVQALNPSRGTISFWTQHTIFATGFAAVRWYEMARSVPPACTPTRVNSRPTRLAEASRQPSSLKNVPAT